MNKRILWIEDDYYAIKGLMRPLENLDFKIDPATSATEGYKKAMDWKSYDLIVVDLILPLSNEPESVPAKVRSWKNEEHIGVGLYKWLTQELKVGCPVLLLSVVSELENLGLAHYLPKRGLLPSQVKQAVFKQLGIEG